MYLPHVSMETQEFGSSDSSSCKQVYVKFSALFRVSRMPFPYEDLTDNLSKVVSSFGPSRVMWGR